MFRQNPWVVYAGVVTVSLAFYYIIILWRFYRRDLFALALQVRNRKLLQSANESTLLKTEVAQNGLQETYDNADEPIASDDLKSSWKDEALFFKVQSVTNHLTLEIEEAQNKRYSREDLIQMLQLILKEYPVLKGTPFQFAVNNHIEAECAKYGSIHLSNGDLKQIWSEA